MSIPAIAARRHVQSGLRWLSATPARFRESDEVLPAAPTVAHAKNVWSQPPHLALRRTPRLQLAANLVNPELTDGVQRDAPSLMQTDQKQRAHRTVMAQRRFEQLVQAEGKTMPHWREVLEKLKSRTPRRRHGWRPNAVKILVPGKYQKMILSDVDYNIWEICSRTRAGVTLYRGGGYDEVDGVGLDRTITLILSGDDVVVRKATNMIIRMAPEAVVTIRSDDDPDDALLPPRQGFEVIEVLNDQTGRAASVPRFLREFNRPLKEFRTKHRLEDIPKPAEWTQHRFCHYIQSLLAARLYPLSAIQYYGSLQASDEIRMVLLTEAFRDPALTQFQSVKAYTLALNDIQNKGVTFRPHSRRLFALMRLRKLPLDTTIFNQFLLGAAKIRDLYNFSQLLDFMASHHCTPDFETWRFFLLFFTDERDKLEIIRAMHPLGLLEDPRAPAEIAKELVPYDTFRAVQNGKSVSDICTWAEQNYGPKWFSSTLLTRMVTVFAYFREYAKSFALIHRFEKQYGCLPRGKTYEVILRQARYTMPYFRPAIWIVCRADRDITKTHHRTSSFYDSLWDIAWRFKLYNVLAVVWLYSCLHEMTSYKMRTRVTRHILHPGYMFEPRKVSNTLRRRFATPGFIPVEIQKQLEAKMQSDARDRENPGPAIARLIREQYQGYMPKQPLWRSLEHAYNLDRLAGNKELPSASQPGAHSVDVTLPSNDSMTMEIPIEDKWHKRADALVTIPTTTVAAVFNFVDEFYAKSELHPLIKLTPNSCEISWPSDEIKARADALAQPRAKVGRGEDLEASERLAEGESPTTIDYLEKDIVVRGWQEETTPELPEQAEAEDDEEEWGDEKRAEEGVKPRLSAWFSELEEARVEGPQKSGQEDNVADVELIRDEDNIPLDFASGQEAVGRGKPATGAAKKGRPAGRSMADRKSIVDSWERLEGASKVQGRG